MLVFPIYLLGLIFSPCTCFFFGLFIFVPLQFFPAFSLPDIFFCGLVVPTFGMVLVQDWSYGALPGLAALYIYIYMYIYISLKSHLRLDAPDRV